MKKFWWRGKQYSRSEYIRFVKNMTREDLLICHECMKPFVQISKWEWKPDCEHNNIVVGCLRK